MSKVQVIGSKSAGEKVQVVISSGRTGTQGIQGATGAQGFQGAPGTGAQGVIGVQGPTGAQGIQGAPGTGAQGNQGDIGPQGIQGATGSLTTFNSGVVASTYGGGSNVAVFTVGANGIISFAANAAISGVSNFTASGNSFVITTSAGNSFAANIQPNSIRLGDDTTGSCVSNLVAGTGVILTNLGDETAIPTIAIGQAVGSSNDVIFANITSNYNVTVNANLYFNLVDAGEY